MPDFDICFALDIKKTKETNLMVNAKIEILNENVKPS